MGRIKKTVTIVTHIVRNPEFVRPKNSTKRDYMCTADENLCRLDMVGIENISKSSKEFQLWKGIHKLR